jgi:hypothetical protein
MPSVLALKAGHFGYPVVVITWVFFSVFFGNFENFKVKKLLLDDVLQSSRCYHWIPLDLVYLVVTLRSSKKSSGTL